MVDLGQGARFEPKPAQKLVVAHQERGDDLQRLDAVQREVACLVDDAHAAPADHVEDAVAVDLLADEGILLRGGLL